MYEWLKALHVIAVMAWMAGLLYLPRLFVYHCAAETGSMQSETFKVMERRLLKAIMTPAMAASWVLGMGMLAQSQAAALGTGWAMWMKLALVVVLSSVHGSLAVHVRAFAADANRRRQRYFRILKEIPTALMMAIVILVIVRPF